MKTTNEKLKPIVAVLQEQNNNKANNKKFKVFMEKLRIPII